MLLLSLRFFYILIHLRDDSLKPLQKRLCLDYLQATLNYVLLKTKNYYI